MPLPSADELEAQAREVERAAAARAAQIQKEAAVRAAQLRRDAADVRKLERRLGVAPGTAAEAQRQLSALVPLDESPLPSVVHSGSIGRTMEAPKDENPRRRGRKIENPDLPMAVASANSGLSIYEIAKRLGEPYSTVKSWGVKSAPPPETRRVLAAWPYLVPETAWET